MFCEECLAAVAIGRAQIDALGIARRPLQHLHAAHRAAGDAKQRLDAEMIDQHRLGAHHVGDRDERQVEAIGCAGRRIGRGRAGRAHAAADDIGADDEEAVGVDRLAGADHGLPPAVLAGDRIAIGDMLIAGQGVADEDRVGLGGVERAIGLIGDAQRREVDAGVHRQRAIGSEAQDEAVRRVGFAGAARRIGQALASPKRGFPVCAVSKEFGIDEQIV